MGQRTTPFNKPASSTPPSSLSETAADVERLVTTALDDSWSTLDAEVTLIDRLFGGEIAALFERK
jgi:hypothetical protein